MNTQNPKTDLPPLPKPFLVVKPKNSEPYGLFSVKQMIEYRKQS